MTTTTTATDNNGTLETMINILEGARDDNTKFFDSGVNAAGTRVRKAMQEVKTLAQQLRTEVQDAKNTK